VVIEKPFGHDLASAQELNATVNSVFPEESVFRIDHYLGKETVQNILALRFANNLYEPIWNNNYVDSVQITMAEDIGLGGRGGYYDGVGAARDVIQNHLIQLMALTAMEEPVNFSPHELQAEKIKVLSATRPMQPLDETTSRGQYSAGWQGSEKVPGLLEEEGFSKDSKTETYAAIALEIDTRRWAGVPFLLRTGKRLGRRVTEIALLFKKAPHLPFDTTMTEELGKNALVIRVQPDEGITLRFGSKVPGSQMEVRDVNMDFSYGSAFAEDSPEAYERLILWLCCRCYYPKTAMACWVNCHCGFTSRRNGRRSCPTRWRISTIWCFLRFHPRPLRRWHVIRRTCHLRTQYQF
jgi:glucose-6-phosphate 1-dehydrogenase